MKVFVVCQFIAYVGLTLVNPGGSITSISKICAVKVLKPTKHSD